MKYIFLDIDGVLNNYTSGTILDDQNVQVFKELCDALGDVHIIISSSWRFFDDVLMDLKECFESYGIPLWEGITSKDRKLQREEQVLLYMSEHNIAEEEMVILDDIYFFKKLEHRFVNTSMKDGLTAKDMERVLELFEVC